MFINIITPCSRPKNIQTIFESICIPLENYHWYVVFDLDYIPKTLPVHPNITYISHRNDKSKAGNSQRNIALEIITDDYVYFLDDDTIMHPELWDRVNSFTSDIIIFNQCHKNETLRLYGGFIEPGAVDTGNLIVHRNTIGPIRWDVNEYNGDGFFFKEVSKNTKKKKYIPIILSYYNKLK